MHTKSADGLAAGEIAAGAGRLLLELRAGALEGAELKAAGDRAAHEFIVGELRRRFPDDAVVSEEGHDDAARLNTSRVWIVDPLDGTREFSEPPRTDWAVHVALVEDGELAAGAVALPARGLTLSTADPPQASCRTNETARVVVSRTRPGEQSQRLAERMAAQLVPMGSAGAKAMAVVLGEADVYMHSGGQYEWDSAAPAAVASAAGLHVSRLDGTALRYNQPDVWLPDLLICRPELARTVIAICQEIST